MAMLREEKYQIALITLGVIVTSFFAVFVYREAFPEYKIYQDRYVELENFRSTYTGEPPPDFQKGVKQLLFEDPHQGQPKIDRCITCHIAMEYSHFSPTKIAHDVNGNIIRDVNGFPVKVPNEDYVWGKLDEKIKQLEKEGNQKEAERLQELKTVEIGEVKYDVTKALRMHPLMGSETRPFEFHTLNNYGCTVCHNGNGFALTASKAHGPVFDGQYENEFTGPTPIFLETDPINDTLFAKAYNGKPGESILFQSNPLFVGHVIQAKCIQCHLTSNAVLMEGATRTALLSDRVEERTKVISDSLENEKKALLSLIKLREEIQTQGYTKTVEDIRKKSQDFSLSQLDRQEALSQLHYLSAVPENQILEKINSSIKQLLGSDELAKQLDEAVTKETSDTAAAIEKFINDHANSASGSIFARAKTVQQDQSLMPYVKNVDSTWKADAENRKNKQAFTSELDLLTKDYQRGKDLYINQACYGCHRINGFSRGGVGPELTNEGNAYLWFVKEKIVWPQSDLPTSTMPNYRLAQSDVEDLTTFLMAQKGQKQSISDTAYQMEVKSWETGRKMPWELPINPVDLHNVKYGMTVFATEGCASCHRLKGFESNVGFRVEKEKTDFETRYKEHEWFQKLFPETIVGSEIVKTLETKAQEIDEHIADDVRKDTILEEIERNHPGLFETFYEHFTYADRAKNHEYSAEQLKEWKERLHRVLMMFIQEYGLGRIVGPRPNWSGIYRTDQWLIEHFEKPNRHTARSLMPAMPFDISKFYALTYMLDMLAIKNRDEVREIWTNRGFNPAQAYHIHCSQCHGEFLHGDGPVAQWIYPIPKNLRNADFLTNYTKDNVIQSITHGVKGTPMPPWGEAAMDKPMADGIPELTQSEIKQLVDWIYSGLLTGTSITSPKDIPKWRYGPKDIIQEMKKEKRIIEKGGTPLFFDIQEMKEKPQEKKKSTFVSKKPAKEIALNDPSAKSNADDKVSEFFDVKPNPLPGPEKNLYFIKKQYYTKDNIEAGQRFFELNCAVCHGKEADGMGYRSGSMFDAKPRMLTNLHWIETRDDLRLLRSIKYGVPGTAMTPWGDLTTGQQRMQLVMFIRTLSQEQEQRDLLFDAIYQSFDVPNQILVDARASEYAQIDQLEKKIEETREQRTTLFKTVSEGQGNASDAVKYYQDELILSQQLHQHEESDAILVDLQKELAKEKDVYLKLGITLINKTLLYDVFDKFLKLIRTHKYHFVFKNGNLTANFSDEIENESQKYGEEIISIIDALLDSQKKKLEDKDNDAQMKKELESNIRTLTTLKQDMISGFADARRSRERQQKLYNEYTQKLKTLNVVKNK